MLVLSRMVMVFVGYVLACIAAAIVLTIGTLTPDWDELNALGFSSAALWPVVGVSAAIIVFVAFVPALLVIVLAEGFAWRSVLIYAVAGAALALALSYGIDLAGYVGDSDAYLTHAREVMAASGIAGGLVYWLFAGRNAGLWR